MTHCLYKIVCLSVFAFFFAACRIQVDVDDIGDGGNSNDSEPRNVDDTSFPGFQNKTIVSLGDTGIGFGGVDILLVVDNSDTMSEEQASFATEIYALISELRNPTDGGAAVTNIRLATVTTDLGLQAGENNVIDSTEIEYCGGLGDNGLLGDVESTSVILKDNRIICEASGAQCPSDWSCENGYCKAPFQGSAVDCNFTTGNSWIETTSAEPDLLFAEKAACLAVRGTGGCTVEQQLESMLRALYNNPDFLSSSHMLAVVILSDEEDCSIEDSELFNTAEWSTEETRQIACNFPEANNNYLFDPSRYLDKLVSLKNNNLAAVLFAAAVGTPGGSCTGTGTSLSERGCLFDDGMQLVVQNFQSGEVITKGFKTACTRVENNVYVTAARPGRRFVETASLFGAHGFVQSICDSSLTSLVDYLADTMKSAAARGQCLLSEALETQAAPSSTCPSCVEPGCEMYVEILRTGDEAKDTTCPKSLVFGTDYYAKAALQQKFDGEELVSTRMFCPVEKFPTPLDCDAETSDVDHTRAGWAYCENQTETENTEYTCSDGVDNDSDGFTDCDADACSYCMMCGHPSSACQLGCRYNIVMTQAAEDAAKGNNLFLECPFR